MKSPSRSAFSLSGCFAIGMTPASQKTLVAMREHRDIVIKTIGEIDEGKV